MENEGLYTKIVYRSNYLYNEGLKKAKVRDLSGAVICLRESLSLNRKNTNARNLLGLVYFEMGEVVQALAQWIISRNNDTSKDNPALYYMDKIKSNQGKLEAIDGVDVVRGRAIWSIQPGQIARKISERELEEIEKLKGVIVQEGCQAIIFANGELVAMLSAGAYQFFKSVEEEKAALREAVEKAEQELDEKERKAREQQRQKEPTFRDLGIVGEIGRFGRWVGRLIFGEKKDEKKEKIERRSLPTMPGAPWKTPPPWRRL